MKCESSKTDEGGEIHSMKRGGWTFQRILLSSGQIHSASTTEVGGVPLLAFIRSLYASPVMSHGTFETNLDY